MALKVGKQDTYSICIVFRLVGTVHVGTLPPKICLHSKTVQKSLVLKQVYFTHEQSGLFFCIITEGS